MVDGGDDDDARLHLEGVILTRVCSFYHGDEMS